MIHESAVLHTHLAQKQNLVCTWKLVDGFCRQIKGREKKKCYTPDQEDGFLALGVSLFI